MDTPSFTLAEYTAVALAKVWTNKAKLPNSETMRALYEQSVEERGGYGKYVLFWGYKRSSGKPIHSPLVFPETGHMVTS